MTREEFTTAILADISPDCPTHLREIVVENYGIEEQYDRGLSVNDALIEQHYREACRRADRNA